ncbi:MAG TPA: hypothetical protein VKD22_16040 [Ramlibacter sp.]|nr:hypothetical protein [Ramlibacter sp.]
MEADFSIVECFSTGSSCMLTGSCKLTGVMEGALGSFMEHLDRHTLADILPDAPGTRRTHLVHLQRPPRKAAAR